MATVQEQLPPTMEANSDPPTIFDGSTRLYMAYICPFSQRAWITRNYKKEIKLVPLNLEHLPTWYKKFYRPNKVPALEHDKVSLGESLNLIRFIDNNFEGSFLFPDDPAKMEFAEEMLAYADKFNTMVFDSFKGGDIVKEAGVAFDYIENFRNKFEDGPFFLGEEFSLVDIACAPFIERFQLLLSHVWKYEIAQGRPKVAAWIEELNKIEAYTQTKYRDPKDLL